MSVFIEGSGDGRTDLFLEAEAAATTPSGIPGGREENLEGKNQTCLMAEAILLTSYSVARGSK